MKHLSRELGLYALAGVVICALTSGGLLALRQAPRGQRQLDTARARWAGRHFSHYRLDLRLGALGSCRQLIEIDGERVVAVAENTCATRAPTVSELFDRIERDIRTLGGRCGPNGCACDGTLVVDARYDPQLGYPLTKRIALDGAARWRFPEYWRRKLAGGLCSSRELGQEVITVVSLQPLS